MLLRLAAQLMAAVLLAFSLRRAVLLAAAIARPRRPPETDERPGACSRAGPRRSAETDEQALPFVTLMVPCRNEAASLPALMRRVDGLDYPRERLGVVIVDDGSTDATASVARAWAQTRPWARALTLPDSVGKADALNAALALPDARPAGQEDNNREVLVIYDADHCPAPDALRSLVAALADLTVAGASGQMRVANGAASPAAFYAHLESLVNQLITMRGKDRLDLAPALLGSNCAYRAAAVEAVGGFRRGALLEDSDLTLALALAGWRTRFVAESVSEHHAPVSVRGYLRQHLRWNHGFQQVTGARLAALWRSPRLPLRHKVELTFFALGYADRLALLGGAAATAVDLLRPGTFHFPLAVWPIYFGLPALEMLAALRLAGEPASMYARLVYVPFFFMLDIAAAAWSAAMGMLRRPVAWKPTERSAVKPQP